MLLNDKAIIAATLQDPPLIAPFYPWKNKTRQGLPAISFGLSGAGYDITLSSHDFRISAEPAPYRVLDPKEAHDCDWSYELARVDKTGVFFIIPPHGYALGVTSEEFHIPPNIMGVCVGKSTYARSGLFINTTPLEPGWNGYLTLELANLTGHFLKVYAEEGIAQVLFWETAETSSPYEGKYQDQPQESVLSRMDGQAW